MITSFTSIGTARFLLESPVTASEDHTPVLLIKQNLKPAESDAISAQGLARRRRDPEPLRPYLVRDRRPELVRTMITSLSVQSSRSFLSIFEVLMRWLPRDYAVRNAGATSKTVEAEQAG